MNFFRRNPDLKSISGFIRCYSAIKKSHYDVLKLRKSCTEKEIKEAFIKLSKEFHPDKNKDVNAQEQFIRILEAYNVLSKPGSRSRYDSMVDAERYQGANPHMYRHNPYAYNYQYQNFSRREHNRQREARQQATNSNPYYGTVGVRKMPNYVLIIICFGIAFVGSLLQVIIIREMYFVQKRQALERSKYLAEELEKVRSAAKGNTNEVQTRLLLEKIVTAANPTVATASLGQALANEKKPSLSDTMLTEYEIGESYENKFGRPNCKVRTISPSIRTVSIKVPKQKFVKSVYKVSTL